MKKGKNGGRIALEIPDREEKEENGGGEREREERMRGEWTRRDL